MEAKFKGQTALERKANLRRNQTLKGKIFQTRDQNIYEQNNRKSLETVARTKGKTRTERVVELGEDGTEIRNQDKNEVEPEN